MDAAIRQKMNRYLSEVESSGHVPNPIEGHSTLSRAEVSVFHESPPLDQSHSDHITFLKTERSDYEKGVQKGKDEERHLNKQTIAVMQTAINKLQTELEFIKSSVEQSHLTAIRKILVQAFPHIVKGDVRVQLSTIIKASASDALTGQIVVTAHPEDIKACKQLCGKKSEAFVYVEDESRDQESINFRWKGGGADIKAAEAAQAILDILDSSIVGDCK